MPPFGAKVDISYVRVDSKELGEILQNESSHCLTGTTKCANIKQSPHFHYVPATNQIPGTTPNEGSDTHLKNDLGHIPKG